MAKPKVKRPKRPPAKGGTEHNGIRWTVERAAVEFTVDRHTLTRLLRRSDMTPGPDGKWSTRQVCAVVFGDKYSEEVLAIRVSRERDEVGLALDRGRAFDAADVRAAWDGVVLGIRQRVLAAGSKIESQFVPGMVAAQVRDLVDREHRDALEELSRTLDYKPKAAAEDPAE